MSYGIGGYQLIDFKGIDLINEETPNNSVYEQIEKANKNKPLCIVNIVKDKIEYQAQFINVNVDNSNFTFYLLDRFIKVSPTKVESLSLVKNIDATVANNYDLDINNDLLSYNHTEIISFTQSEIVYDFNIYPVENIELPYNIIFTNPIGVYSYKVTTEPTNETIIDFDGFSYTMNTADSKYYMGYAIKIYNLKQIVIKVIDRNIYLSFFNGVEL